MGPDRILYRLLCCASNLSAVNMISIVSIACIRGGVGLVVRVQWLCGS